MAGKLKPRQMGGLEEEYFAEVSVEDFAAANELTADEEQVVRIFTFWQDETDLNTLIDLLRDMVLRA